MKLKPVISFAMATLLFAANGFAQPDASLDKKIAGSLHENGSINVVFAVIAVIFAGIFITLWRIDRKVAKLEKEMNEPKS